MHARSSRPGPELYAARHSAAMMATFSHLGTLAGTRNSYVAASCVFVVFDHLTAGRLLWPGHSAVSEMARSLVTLIDCLPKTRSRVKRVFRKSRGSFFIMGQDPVVCYARSCSQVILVLVVMYLVHRHGLYRRPSFMAGPLWYFLGLSSCNIHDACVIQSDAVGLI